MFIPSYSIKYLRLSLKNIGIISIWDIFIYTNRICWWQYPCSYTIMSILSKDIICSIVILKIFIGVGLPLCQSVSLPFSLSQYTFLQNSKYLAFEIPWLIKENLWLEADILGIYFVCRAAVFSIWLTYRIFGAMWQLLRHNSADMKIEINYHFTANDNGNLLPPCPCTLFTDDHDWR